MTPEELTTMTPKELNTVIPKELKMMTPKELSTIPLRKKPCSRRTSAQHVIKFSAHRDAKGCITIASIIYATHAKIATSPSDFVKT
jgi:hypothetical protein